MGCPSISERTLSITSVIGWFSAKPRNHGTIDSAGTKALLANVSGKMITNVNH